jgi:hypothetical protein
VVLVEQQAALDDLRRREEHEQRRVDDLGQSSALAEGRRASAGAALGRRVLGAPGLLVLGFVDGRQLDRDCVGEQLREAAER